MAPDWRPLGSRLAIAGRGNGNPAAARGDPSACAAYASPAPAEPLGRPRPGRAYQRGDAGHRDGARKRATMDTDAQGTRTAPSARTMARVVTTLAPPCGGAQ